MRLVVPRGILDDARHFFENAGARGCEGTGMLAGRRGRDHQVVTRFVAPDQQASNTEGCWVAVTDAGKLQLVAALAPDEEWVARIHSHPAAAFHSSTDDRNPVLTAEGSWSIVVPYFGLGLRRGIGACAVYRRENGRWRELTADEVGRSVECR